MIHSHPELPINMYCNACGSSDKSIKYTKKGTIVPYEDAGNPPNEFAVKGLKGYWEAGCDYMQYKCNTCNYGWVTLPYFDQVEG